jgi:hypothetical protein
MSSIKKISKCSYCQYPIYKQQCSRCFFWQKNASFQNVNKYPVKKLFDRIFILTLKYDEQKKNINNKSRWNLFQKRTLPLCKNYQCIKFIGIDGKNHEEVASAIFNLFPDDKEIQSTIIQNQKHYPGSTGCYLSHLSIWKTIYETKRKSELFALVLEDDAVFEKHGIKNMEILMNKELKDAEFDIVYLGHSPKLKGIRVSPLLLKPTIKKPEFRTNCGFWGYIIRISSIPNLIDSVQSFSDQSIDATIQNKFGDSIDALFLISPIIFQSSMYSIRTMMDSGAL